MVAEIVEVRGEEFDEGSNYAQVTRDPTGSSETVMKIERLEDLADRHVS
jgi:hypothetical protein